jgi:hypothetical protein
LLRGIREVCLWQERTSKRVLAILPEAFYQKDKGVQSVCELEVEMIVELTGR